MSAVSGTVAPGFEPVADAFAATLDGAAGGDSADQGLVDGDGREGDIPQRGLLGKRKGGRFHFRR